MHGVEGEMVALKKTETLWQRQRFISVPRLYKGEQVKFEARFDDDCGNKHNTFAITGETYTIVQGRKREGSGGCIHDVIAGAFPEVAHLIKWHLVSDDGPMHYIANTLYHASDRDYNGRAKGEPSSWESGYKFGDSPVTHRLPEKFVKWIEARRADPCATEFQVIAIAHEDRPGESFKFSPNYTFVGFGEKWHECPFKDLASAEEFAYAFNNCKVTLTRNVTGYSEGKERELEHARSSAVWPEATDEQLCLPKEELKALLEARHPALMADFYAAMSGAGFKLTPKEL